MPAIHPSNKLPKSLRDTTSWESCSSYEFDPQLAGKALVAGINYLKERLGWSGSKVANILHLPANTLNAWLKKGIIPVYNSSLSPDVQAIVHLVAIHRSLEAMFEDPLHQRAWLVTFHPELTQAPEILMGQSIDNLIFVRQYLDYVRGRGA